MAVRDEVSRRGRRIEQNLRVRRFEVDHNYEGWRLDEFLAQRVEGMSRSLAGRIARSGNVELWPPRKVKAGTRVRTGDVAILKQRLAPEYVLDEFVEVLFEDEALLVLDKPAGMLVHETARVRLNTITHFLKRQGWSDAEPVHRLDKDTSGVLICARKPEFVAPLHAEFRSLRPVKLYRALVVDPDRSWEIGERRTIAEPLGFDQKSSLPMRVWRGDLPATTHVRVLGRRSHPMGDLADLEVQIETGRQHQIRVHLAMQGTPIAGDKLYGRDDQFFRAISDHPNDESLLGQLHYRHHALLSRMVRIRHPVLGEELEFEAPLRAPWS